MQPSQHQRVMIALKMLAGVLIAKIIGVTFLSYRDYLPPNFDVAFLQGREAYFWQGYHWAFYVHIFSGPLSLLLGVILLSDRFRVHRPGWHRKLGRIQAANVLLVVAPSGLWMARYSAMGPVAGVGFALLAVATGFTVTMGWWAAVARRFAAHRCWMLRCYVLLCSAVLIRVNGGLGLVAGIEAKWFYIQIAWTSWLIPLLLLEVWFRAQSMMPVQSTSSRPAHANK